MYPFLLGFASLSTVGVVMIARASRNAPEGYEDADGFHAVNPDELAAAMPAEPAFGFDDLFLLDRQMASQPWR